ncbi:MAG TPA: hypothetical protein VF144_05705 [Chitinophagaceae bacterium]
MKKKNANQDQLPALIPFMFRRIMVGSAFITTLIYIIIKIESV